MKKRIIFNTHDRDGNWFAETIDVMPRSGGGLAKIAGEMHPEVAQFLRELRPDPRYQYVLMTPMGSFEYWGMNVNGDVFPEISLSYNYLTRSDHDRVALELERKWLHPHGKTLPPGDWSKFGYKTFEEAFRYRHHINRDPSIAYGDIPLAVWNPRMHRVEVIARHDREKAKRVGAEEIIIDLDNGKPRQISMGCRVRFDVCFPGSTYVFTKFGPQQIKDIKYGDYVYTKQGNLKKVTKTFKRGFDEDVIEIRTQGLLPTTATWNHPYFVIRKEQVRACCGSLNEEKPRYGFKEGDLSILEVPAEDLHVGDFLATPVIPDGDSKELGPQLSYLLGAYAGGGSPIRQYRGQENYITGLQIACGNGDPHIGRLCAALTEISNLRPEIYGDDGEDIFVKIHDRDLAERVISFFEGKGPEKRFTGVLDHNEDRLAFLGGFIDNDGCFDETGVFQISNTSPELARSAWWIAVRSMLPASLSSYTNSSSHLGKDIEGFSVYFPASCAEHLAHYSAKVEDIGKKESTAGFFWDTGRQVYYCLPIKSLEAKPYDGTVYNLSVEGDETYIVEGASVHNCTVCGNISRTQRDYCEHLRTSMGRILDDGRIVGAVNFFPNFFDLSDVIVPAAKESGVLMKVAGNQSRTQTYPALGLRSSYPLDQPNQLIKTASRNLLVKRAKKKEADINKNVLPNTGYSMARRVADQDEDLPREVLQTEDIQRLLATLAMLGIVLKPREFQYSAVHRMSPELADRLYDGGLIFPHRAASCPVSLSPRDFDIDMARRIVPLLSGRSAFHPHVGRRVIRITMVKRASQNTPRTEHVMENNMLMSKLGEAYTAYRDSLLHLPQALDVAVQQHFGYYQKNFFGDLLGQAMTKTAEITELVPDKRKLTSGYLCGAFRDTVCSNPWDRVFGLPSNSTASLLLGS